jgi:hypothetical protein
MESRFFARSAPLRDGSRCPILRWRDLVSLLRPCAAGALRGGAESFRVKGPRALTPHAADLGQGRKAAIRRRTYELMGELGKQCGIVRRESFDHRGDPSFEGPEKLIDDIGELGIGERAHLVEARTINVGSGTFHAGEPPKLRFLRP